MFSGGGALRRSNVVSTFPFSHGGVDKVGHFTCVNVEVLMVGLDQYCFIVGCD
jgi:hypothetical protein